MPDTDPQAAQDITAESTIAYDMPRGSHGRYPEGVVVTIDEDIVVTLTPEQARDLADQLVTSAIASENAGEQDDHDRAAATFRGQFG